MTITEYQNIIWDLFKPEIKNDKIKAELYLAGKLINEVSEVWELAFTLSTRNFEEAEKTFQEKIIDEAGDVLWYIINGYKLYGIPLGESVRNPEATSTSALMQLTVISGKILGKILKRDFHGKPVLEEVLQAYYHQCFVEFMNFIRSKDINLTLEQVMEFNVNKLHNRHGQTYNKDFYQK